MKKLTSLLALAASASLALTACSGGGAADNSEASDPGEKGFDVSTIKADPEIEKLVPKDIKESGVLTNGASTDYAPAEYKKADGQTPTGYDVDMVKAIAALMGLKGETQHYEFDSLIPKIGKNVNIGVSAFTITPERLKEFNMIAYAEVGFQYATAKGNPNKFDPTNPCGRTIGVQTGTAQQEWLENESKKCTEAGKKAIDIKPSKAQTEVVPKVASKQYDAMIADSPVAGYATVQTNGEVELLDKPFETAKHGIVIPKDQAELTEAVQKAVQKLMDDGTLKKIFDLYGASDSMMTKAELNPTE